MSQFIGHAKHVPNPRTAAQQRANNAGGIRQDALASALLAGGAVKLALVTVPCSAAVIVDGELLPGPGVGIVYTVSHDANGLPTLTPEGGQTIYNVYRDRVVSEGSWVSVVNTGDSRLIVTPPANANRQNVELFNMFRVGLANVADPGASGTITMGERGIAVCEIVTAAAESRALIDAAQCQVGQLLLLVGKTLVGTATITGGQVDVLLHAAGDTALLCVGRSGANKVWRVLAQSRLQSQFVGAKTDSIAIDNEWRVWDAIETNLGNADGTDDLGLVTGTYLTSAPSFNVTVATPTAAPFYARKVNYKVPRDYRAGTNLTLKLTVTQTVAATTATIDAFAVRKNAPNVDIVATAAQSIIGAAATVYSFVLTGTNVVPGETLDIRIAVTLDDGAATPNYSVTKVDMDYTAG